MVLHSFPRGANTPLQRAPHSPKMTEPKAECLPAQRRDKESASSVPLPAATKAGMMLRGVTSCQRGSHLCIFCASARLAEGKSRISAEALPLWLVQKPGGVCVPPGREIGAGSSAQPSGRAARPARCPGLRHGSHGHTRPVERRAGTQRNPESAAELCWERSGSRSSPGGGKEPQSARREHKDP